MADRFTQKFMRVTFSKKNGTVYRFEEHAMTASVLMTSGAEVPTATVRIWGLPINVIRDLTVGVFFNTEDHFFATLRIYAGDKPDVLPLLFEGTVRFSSADFNSGESVLTINAVVGMLGQATTEKSVTYEGDAKTFIASEAQKMKFALKYDPEFEGKKVKSTYYGAPLEKIRKCAKEIGANIFLENKTVWLTKRDMPATQETFIFSAQNGMIGYPKLTEMGVEVVSYFKPSMRNCREFTIDSDLPFMRNKWLALEILHELAVNHPTSNVWKTTVKGFAYEIKQQQVAEEQARQKALQEAKEKAKVR